MPVLRKFMCCCQLATGAVVIGWIGLVLLIIGLAGDAAFLANIDTIFPPEYHVSGVKIPLSVTIACDVIAIVSHICLLWGANSRNRLFLLPWLISTMIFIIATFLSILILGIVLASSSANGGIVATIFILGFSFTGFVLYLWLCILSLFQELRANTEDSIALSPPDYSCPPYNPLKETC